MNKYVNKRNGNAIVENSSIQAYLQTISNTNCASRAIYKKNILSNGPYAVNKHPKKVYNDIP